MVRQKNQQQCKKKTKQWAKWNEQQLQKHTKYKRREMRTKKGEENKKQHKTNYLAQTNTYFKSGSQKEGFLCGQNAVKTMMRHREVPAKNK